MATSTRGLNGRVTAYGPGTRLTVRDDAHDRRRTGRLRDLRVDAGGQVEDDHIRTQPPHRAGRVLRIGHQVDLEALAGEIETGQIGDAGVVFDDEHAAVAVGR